MSGSLRRRSWPSLVALAALACGKKGPPQPPLEAKPAPIADLVAVQWGDEIVVTATLPARYLDGIALEPARAEVRMVSEAAAAAVPPPLPSLAPLPIPTMRERGSVDPAAPAPATLTEPAAAPVASPPVAAPAPTPSPVDPVLAARARALGNRFERDARRAVQLTFPEDDGRALAEGRLVVRLPAPADRHRLIAIGVRLHGRRSRDVGVDSNVVTLELLESQPAPPAPRVKNGPGGLVIETGATKSSPVAVYRYPRPGSGPVLPLPIGGRPTVEPELTDSAAPSGQTVCYAVATVVDPALPAVMSRISLAACETRRDVFAPEPPSRLQSFVASGSVSLIWIASPSPDVAGYHVYRYRGDRRERLTKQAVTGASYTDTTPVKGELYEYEVTAIDGATPANESAPTPRVKETGF